MNIAITGGSGFLGRHLIRHFESRSHHVTAWQRPGGGSIASPTTRVIPGSLDDAQSADQLCDGQDAVIHACVNTPGERFVGGEGDPTQYFQTNVVGSMRLIDAARRAGVPRFVFISSGAVHQRTLPVGDLDETHPLWPMSVYGAAKASIETIIHATGWGSPQDDPSTTFVPCTLRPTSIYGIADPIESSRFFDLVRSVVVGAPDQENTVVADGGGKMVHANEIAEAAECLLTSDADLVRGQTFNCTSGLVSRHQVAQLAKRISGSSCVINGTAPSGGRIMKTDKLTGLGFQFAPQRHLEATIRKMIDHIKA